MVAVLLLFGCSTIRTGIEKSELKVETQMSSSIFLEPRPPEQRVILVDVRQTVDRPGFDIEPRIKEQIRGHGYTLTEDPAEAYYLLQVNVLKIGESDLKSVDNALEGGFGSAVIGAAVGAAIGLAVGDSGEAAVAGAAIGGAVAVVGDYIGGAIVKDLVYTVIADVQISERSDNVTESGDFTATQGDKTSVRQTAAEMPERWKKYRTRVVGKANQVNLTAEEAIPPLSDGMARAVGGIF